MITAALRIFKRTRTSKEAIARSNKLTLFLELYLSFPPTHQARVNKIRQSRKISASDDLMLTGQVVWVGNSSLDVLMEIHRLKDIKINPEETDDGGAVMIKENVPSRLLSSLFTYVARDRQTGKSCAINRFIPTGKDEEELCARRNNIAISRKLTKKAGVKSGGNGSGESVDAQVIQLEYCYCMCFCALHNTGF